MRIAAAALSALLLMSVATEARPRHHRHHHAVHTRHPRALAIPLPQQAHDGVGGVIDDRYLAATWSIDRSGHTPWVASGRSPWVASGRRGQDILEVARGYLGRGKVTPFAGPWCRDFTNKVLTEAGVPLRDQGRDATGALRLGTRVATPEIGDLVVMSSHVTFFAGRSETGRILGLGGNQGPRPRGVTISEYSPSRVLGYVRVQ